MFWIFVIAAALGYIIGHYVHPNIRLRKAISEAKEIGKKALGEGNQGVYRTIITDHNQSSELVVEVREQAVTKSGQVKVEYLSANYKNPVFRTKKGEALLREVRDLLGEFLPANEIEWYENHERHTNINKQLHSLENLQKEHLEK